ncbi:MAG: hypothetical protein KBH81_08190, partial [Phycisphaerae bacterium]|nr:hypothetical protein [Phycisphaerae bacterium]
MILGAAHGSRRENFDVHSTPGFDRQWQNNTQRAIGKPNGKERKHDDQESKTEQYGTRRGRAGR